MYKMNELYDCLEDGTIIKIKEIADDDYFKHCVRCTKEVYINFKKNLIKPCEFSAGIDVNDYNSYLKYVEDINNKVNRIECNYCHINNDHWRIEGNKLWTTPGHGNSHVEFVLGDTFDNNILKKHVCAIAENFHTFACISVGGNEPGLSILEQDHIQLIAKPFFAVNKLKFRRLRYDFVTRLKFSTERAKQIVDYMQKMQKQYPTLDINIQPKNSSIKNNFDEKIDLFVNAGFEIVANTNIIQARLKKLYNNRDNIKLPPRFENV